MSADDRGARRRRWGLIRRVLTLAFFALVLYLLYVNAREIEWSEVIVSLRKLPFGTLAIAAVLTVASHAVYSCYDLLSRRYTGHRLGTGQVLATTFVSYAFNLNLGSLVGGLGFRQRLYSRLGLDTAVIARIIAFSMTTNWFGYLALAGTAFLLRPLALPPDWPIGSVALRVIGAVLLAAALAYGVACLLAGRRAWTVRGHRIELPSWRLAALQFGVSALNWLLIGTIVWVLLQQRIDYPTVLSVLLVGAIAGVITHVPAGLGVLEAVFIGLLGGVLPVHELLGALLAYRAIYYLSPLAIALVIYLGMEARLRRGDTVTATSPAAAARS